MSNILASPPVLLSIPQSHHLAGFLDAMTAEPGEPAHRNALQDWMQDAGLWTEGDLRRLICERPDLDGLRLNFGDWCKQNGRDYEADNFHCLLSISMSGARGRGWRSPALGLLKQHVQLYSMLLADVSQVLRGMTRAIIRLGCVEQVWTTCADWLANGPALVAQQPIVAVRLTNKEPVEQEGDGELWGRSDESDHVGGAHWIPGCIHDFLPLNPRGARFWHPAGKGHAHLSRACVAFARERAGLPPLHF